MTTTYLCRDTEPADTFDTNYKALEADTLFVRLLSESSATEVETTITMFNETVSKLAYHIEIGKVDWSTDRVGNADWSTRFRVGATGDAVVHLTDVELQRVSSDGNTKRATIVVDTGQTDGLTADTNIDDTVTNDTTLDSPAGASATDHLVLMFRLSNTSSHGGAEQVSIEQNTTAGSRVIAPIDAPAGAGFPHSNASIIG